MTGAVLGAAFALGVILVARSLAATRRPALYDRVAPYVRDVDPSIPAPGAVPGWRGLVAAVVARGARLVGEVVGGSASVDTRLRRLGSDATVQDFRVRQLGWGVAGFAACVALCTWWASRSGTSSVALLIVCVVGMVGAVLACDVRLTSRVKAHEQQVRAELPAIAELLALSVAAGEGPVAGLERVTAVSHGALSDELRRVLGAVRTGTPVTRAFDDLARRTGVSGVARFAEGMAVAIDRGTPLVDVLHAQAADVREESRRELMELGGRKEVAMMIPVVFLILPVTIVVAFFPGWIGLHLGSGY